MAQLSKGKEYIVRLLGSVKVSAAIHCQAWLEGGRGLVFNSRAYYYGAEVLEYIYACAVLQPYVLQICTKLQQTRQGAGGVQTQTYTRLCYTPIYTEHGILCYFAPGEQPHARSQAYSHTLRTD